MDSPPGSPKSGPNRKMTLRERYKISDAEVLGEGAAATVYKGLDIEKCRNVAVKLYKSAPGESAVLGSFRQSVHVFEALHAQKFSSAEASGSPWWTLEPSLLDAGARERVGSKESSDSAGIRLYDTDRFLEHLDVRLCFVQLLDYSRTESGEPGLDVADEVLFLVFEIGEESLEDKLAACSEAGKTLSVDELRELHWALVSIVWGLHAVGYLHLDIKPRNVMRFVVSGRDQWKLIDLDGAVERGSRQQLESLTFTPEYMPPELAAALVNAPPSPGGSAKSSGGLTVSRLMDVWSVGMCAMEAIFLQPVLRPFYVQWFEETGDDFKFFGWLSDYSSEPIVSGDMKDLIADIDRDMVDLLHGMLAKDPAQRYSIGQCLAHQWFAPIRDDLLSGGRSVYHISSMTANAPSGSSASRSISYSGSPSGRSKVCAVM